MGGDSSSRSDTDCDTGCEGAYLVNLSGPLDVDGVPLPPAHAVVVRVAVLDQVVVGVRLIQHRVRAVRLPVGMRERAAEHGCSAAEGLEEGKVVVE